jgi:hypothetical protein
MKANRIFLFATLLVSVAVSLGISSCQKMYRPPLVIIPDPPPPPYNPLKSFWEFENNLKDNGENRLDSPATNVSSKNVTYAAGIKGQALKLNGDGYVVFNNMGDSLKNLGAYTVSWWQNSGPATNATGVFSLSNTKEFWGNLEVYFEGFSGDATTGYLKVQMWNKNATKQNEAQEYKIPNVFGKWTHLALTYDSSNSKFRIYSDGVVRLDTIIQSGNYKGLAFNNAGGMVIGTMQFMTVPSLTAGGPQSWARNFNGLIDQFRIYSRALTAAEIQALFTNKQ